MTAKNTAPERRAPAIDESPQRGPLARVGQYRKTLAAVVGAGLTWVSACLGDGSGVTRAEWIALAVAVATAAGVFVSPNEPLEDSDKGATTVGLVLFFVVLVVTLALFGALHHPLLLLLLIVAALCLLF